MGKLHVTVTFDLELDLDQYGVETLSEAAEDLRKRIDNGDDTIDDLLGLDETKGFNVEVKPVE